jgi:hypothetical protein
VAPGDSDEMGKELEQAKVKAQLDRSPFSIGRTGMRLHTDANG